MRGAMSEALGAAPDVASRASAKAGNTGDELLLPIVKSNSYFGRLLLTHQLCSENTRETDSLNIRHNSAVKAPKGRSGVAVATENRR